MKPVWLFDLDNTLHDAGRHIFPHINHAMTLYLAERLSLSLDEACALRGFYWKRFGATLRGMMRNHGERPATFLAATHCFEDLAGMVVFDRALLASLRRLPGRKYIFSNAPRSYVVEPEESVFARRNTRSAYASAGMPNENSKPLAIQS